MLNEKQKETGSEQETLTLDGNQNVQVKLSKQRYVLNGGAIIMCGYTHMQPSVHMNVRAMYVWCMSYLYVML